MLNVFVITAPVTGVRRQSRTGMPDALCSSKTFSEQRARSHARAIMYSAAVPYTYPAGHRALPCSYGSDTDPASGLRATYRMAAASTHESARALSLLGVCAL